MLAYGEEQPGLLFRGVSLYHLDQLRRIFKESGSLDRQAYRRRNCIERSMNRLKQFRRLATRYEKRAENYRAMWWIAATRLWLEFANTP